MHRRGGDVADFYRVDLFMDRRKPSIVMAEKVSPAIAIDGELRRAKI